MTGMLGIPRVCRRGYIPGWCIGLSIPEWCIGLSIPGWYSSYRTYPGGTSPTVHTRVVYVCLSGTRVVYVCLSGTRVGIPLWYPGRYPRYGTRVVYVLPATRVVYVLPATWVVIPASGIPGGYSRFRHSRVVIPSSQGIPACSALLFPPFLLVSVPFLHIYDPFWPGLGLF